MRLRILGSSGIYPTADNPTSGFLVEGGRAKIWLDAGSGTFAALQAVEDFTGIDAVVLSHGHADHCLDVLPLHYALLFHPGDPPRLPLYAPREAWDILSRFYGEQGGFELGQTFDYHPIDAGDEVEVHCVRLTFQRTDHPAHTLAVRAEHEGGVFAYTSDTGPGVDLTDFVAGADLLLCEATYQKGHSGPPVHLSATEAGELACRAQVGELVLTHLKPSLDPARSREEARNATGGLGVSLALPGKVFQVSARD